MSNSTDHQWLPIYQQIAIDEDHHVASSFAFSDAATTAMAMATATENVLSHSGISSCSMMSDHQLVPPKGHHGSKPAVRRRSRASRKTPIKLLNANTNNFRALVQQFTGCPSKTFSFASKKGPVNLNFGLGNDHHDHRDQHHQNHDRYSTGSVAAAFGNINNHYPYNSNFYQQLQQQQQPMSCQEQKQGLVSFDIMGDDGLFATTATAITGGNTVNPNFGFAMDDNLSSFHELTCRDDSYFF